MLAAHGLWRILWGRGNCGFDLKLKVESPQMVKRPSAHVRRPALKHGAYSQSILLPGEDRAAFEQLHADLNVEFTPIGRLEEDIVLTIAQHVWRKQNLATYRVAERARDRWRALKPPELVPQYALSEGDYEGLCAEENDLKRELGESWGLLEMGQVSTIDYALKEATIIDRLDVMIDRCVKRLILVRGFKSISSSSAEPASSRLVKGTAA